MTARTIELAKRGVEALRQTLGAPADALVLEASTAAIEGVMIAMIGHAVAEERRQAEARCKQALDAALKTAALKIEQQIEAAVAQERERCLGEVGQRVMWNMPVPCPDGQPGCCVLHTIRATRDRTPAEIVEAIQKGA
jgi:hypothetical protein